MTSPSEITPGRAAYEAWKQCFDAHLIEDWDKDLADSERGGWFDVASAVLAAAAPEQRAKLTYQLDAANADRNELAHINTSQACLIRDLKASLSSLTDRAEASSAITGDEADEFRKLTARAVPIPGIDDDPADALLALQLPPNDWQAATVRGYFVALLAPLWRDPESFNAKNAVHHDTVYAAMVRAGIVEGEFEDGGLDYVDDVAADMLILAAIAKLGEVTS